MRSFSTLLRRDLISSAAVFLALTGLAVALVATAIRPGARVVSNELQDRARGSNPAWSKTGDGSCSTVNAATWTLIWGPPPAVSAFGPPCTIPGQNCIMCANLNTFVPIMQPSNPGIAYKTALLVNCDVGGQIMTCGPVPGGLGCDASTSVPYTCSTYGADYNNQGGGGN
jgi:hypothetical protein